MMAKPIRALELHYPLIQFFDNVYYNIIMLYNEVLAFESVDEILKCYHSNESY